jgi:DNA mismatch endonuclease (patch repair protein)
MPRTGARKSSRPTLRLDEDTSRRLGRIRQHGTAVELLVRAAVHALGLRYRTINRDLPGSPDLANRRAGWALFVNGCFWHAHRGCSRATLPKRNRPFWLEKFAANRRRDRRSIARLRALGYRTLVLWECQVEDPAGLACRVQRFFG